MNSKETTEANPRRDTEEEIEKREIAETKDCLSIQDADETEASSEDDSEDDSEEDSDVEDTELKGEIISIGKRLETMVSSNSIDEAIGLDLMKTLKTLPMSLDMLKETRIGRSVGIFRKACKTKEAAAMGRTLIKSWQHLLPENACWNKDEANKGEVNFNIQPIVQNIHSKKSDEVEPISRENDNVTMDTLEIHESSSETNDIYVYVKGTHVDITRITSRRGAQGYSSTAPAKTRNQTYLIEAFVLHVSTTTKGK